MLLGKPQPLREYPYSATCNAFPSIRVPGGAVPAVQKAGLGAPRGAWWQLGHREMFGGWHRRVPGAESSCGGSRAPGKRGVPQLCSLARHTLGSLALVAARDSRRGLCGVLGLSPPAGASRCCGGSEVARPAGDGAAAAPNPALPGVLVPVYPRALVFQLFLGINKSQSRAGGRRGNAGLLIYSLTVAPALRGGRWHLWEIGTSCLPAREYLSWRSKGVRGVGLGAAFESLCGTCSPSAGCLQAGGSQSVCTHK